MAHHAKKILAEITRTANRNYRKRRLALVKFLGGKCAYCGAHYSKRHLEFNHKTPRAWVASKLGRLSRLNKYWEEARAGQIDLACATCNKKLGKPVKAFLSNYRNPKEEAHVGNECDVPF